MPLLPDGSACDVKVLVSFWQLHRLKSVAANLQELEPIKAEVYMEI